MRRSLCCSRDGRRLFPLAVPRLPRRLGYRLPAAVPPAVLRGEPQGESSPRGDHARSGPRRGRRRRAAAADARGAAFCATCVRRRPTAAKHAGQQRAAAQDRAGQGAAPGLTALQGRQERGGASAACVPDCVASLRLRHSTTSPLQCCTTAVFLLTRFLTLSSILCYNSKLLKATNARGSSRLSACRGCNGGSINQSIVHVPPQTCGAGTRMKEVQVQSWGWKDAAVRKNGSWVTGGRALGSGHAWPGHVVYSMQRTRVQAGGLERASQPSEQPCKRQEDLESNRATWNGTNGRNATMHRATGSCGAIQVQLGDRTRNKGRGRGGGASQQNVEDGLRWWSA